MNTWTFWWKYWIVWNYKIIYIIIILIIILNFSLKKKNQPNNKMNYSYIIINLESE